MRCYVYCYALTSIKMGWKHVPACFADLWRKDWRQFRVMPLKAKPADSSVPSRYSTYDLEKQRNYTCTFAETGSHFRFHRSKRISTRRLFVTSYFWSLAEFYDLMSPARIVYQKRTGLSQHKTKKLCHQRRRNRDSLFQGSCKIPWGKHTYQQVRCEQ